MSGRSALLIGATGATGKHLLRELLESPQYTRIGEYGRKVTPSDRIPAGQEKLEQKTVNFENLEEAGLKDGKWDVVFITLGTTRKAAGSAAAFEKIDREYVLNAARLAKDDDPAHEQRVVYLSSAGANPNSWFLYPRSKGLTELGLAKLGYQDTIIFRPGMLLNADHPDRGLTEGLAEPIAKLFAHFSSSVAAPVEAVAKAMRIAGSLGSSGLPPIAQAEKAGEPDAAFTAIENSGILALAKNEK
ncbi:hypothetical protein OBBRIDRAFT_790025 [Obba rivulosa]|uniref:NAD-dependent epimerase/dehydratase domain-containing protein n=1 Tax=Obba rivulosa TaxID=1052685 RepID=A0A8E2DQ45_9APHY|nr:hypothetical protein OBBRIDRAFT_790025 [Obba rivulosa]